MENPGLSQQLKLVSTSANYWLIFCVPLVIAGLIIQLILHQVYPFDKYLLEDVALLVTSGFCLLCFSRFIYSKEKFFLWATGLLMLLHFREFHPPNSNFVTYFGLIWFFYYAYKNHHFFADYLRSKYLITLLGVGFFSYLIAVSTDERVWKDFIPIPGEQEFHKKLEETLELIGHIAIGCALLFAAKKPPANS